MKQIIKEYLLLTLGVLCVVVGVYFFKFPNNFAIGGVTGLSMIISNVLGGAISSATLVTIVNTVLLVIGLLVRQRIQYQNHLRKFSLIRIPAAVGNYLTHGCSFYR